MMMTARSGENSGESQLRVYSADVGSGADAARVSLASVTRAA